MSGGSFIDEKIGIRPHKLAVQSRVTGNITGIQDMVSFDENQVVLDTDMGLLTAKDKDMHVNHLTLEKGEVDVEGTIGSPIYSSNTSYRKSDKSVFTRLFK